MKPLILLDIEGTTSSISFVKEILFPYAYERLPHFLQNEGNKKPVQNILEELCTELNCSADNYVQIAKKLQQWIDEDRKHPLLKKLQGIIWKDGYEHNDYQAHFYDDAVTCMKKWKKTGHDIAIYSSGSIPAQHLFFTFSIFGDLRSLISNWFDTSSGYKQEMQSYLNICQSLQRPTSEIVFLSDALTEVKAAREAGLYAIHICRASDKISPSKESSPYAEDFHQAEKIFSALA